MKASANPAIMAGPRAAAQGVLGVARKEDSAGPGGC